MKIATWNINGIKARIDSAIAWLKEASPDVACFQEVWVDQSTGDSLGTRIASRLGEGFSSVESSRLVIEGVSFGNAVVSHLGPASRWARFPAIRTAGESTRRRLFSFDAFNTPFSMSMAVL